MTEVIAIDLGNGQTQVSMGHRTCVMEDRLDLDKTIAALCPTEMIAASIAA